MFVPKIFLSQHVKIRLSSGNLSCEDDWLIPEIIDYNSLLELNGVDERVWMGILGKYRKHWRFFLDVEKSFEARKLRKNFWLLILKIDEGIVWKRYHIKEISFDKLCTYPNSRRRHFWNNLKELRHKRKREKSNMESLLENENLDSKGDKF